VNNSKCFFYREESPYVIQMSHAIRNV